MGGSDAVLQQRRHDAHKLVKAHSRVAVCIHLAPRAALTGAVGVCHAVSFSLAMLTVICAGLQTT